MPRGEETQEIPQEGREESKEVQESKLEAQRTKEVVEEPQAVVEQERDVKESEQIEEELVKAVEAVPLETIPEVSAAVSEVSAELDGKGEGRTGATEASTELDGKGDSRAGATEASTELDGKGERGTAATEIPVAELIPEAGELTPSVTEQVELDGKGEGRTVVEAVPSPEWDDDPPRPPQGTVEDGSEQTEGRIPGEEIQPPPGSVGENLTATPINLPNVAEEPEHGPNPVTNSAQTELIEARSPETEVEEVVLDETSFKVETPLSEEDIRVEDLNDEPRNELLTGEEDGEILDENAFKPVTAREGDVEIFEEDRSLGETDPDAPIAEEDQGLDSPEEPPAEEREEEGEKVEDVKEVKETGPDWYIHEDSEGNKTIVDADGSPIKSPPILYQYKGKTYAAYPGDEPGIDEQGNIKDPSKLIEFPNYQTDVKDMFLHEHSDGSVTVVDKYGNPIPSQPSIITYQGKKYIGYPDQDLGINDKGNVTDPKALEAHEASYFQQSIENMYLHEDGDGNITVVDWVGKPIPSQPVIIDYQGKKYIGYPGQDLGIDEKGNITDPAILKSHEASYLERNTTSMSVYDDGKGNYTVVDSLGNPCPSPPTIFEKDGKMYATYPGWDNGIDEKGNVTDAATLKSREISFYHDWADTSVLQKELINMSVHDDGNGNYTVVDHYGKPIKSPPIVIEQDGRVYLTYPGWDNGINEEGKITDPAKLKSFETGYFKRETTYMYIHDDGKGNYSVVNLSGDPVDSPPIIIEKDGKMYATYPGMEDGIDETGKITHPNMLKLLEISFYTPPWWQKKGVG
jgi:phage-related protein